MRRTFQLHRATVNYKLTCRAIFSAERKFKWSWSSSSVWLKDDSTKLYLSLALSRSVNCKLIANSDADYRKNGGS